MTAEALADTRVVVVNGARQVGKSTLAALIDASYPGVRELYLDDQAVRAAAEADPTAFVRHDSLLMIDEIQRVPQLLLAIKREVDRDTRPGRFLLTGSARLLGLKDLPDAFGRVARSRDRGGCRRAQAGGSPLRIPARQPRHRPEPRRL